MIKKKEEGVNTSHRIGDGKYTLLLPYYHAGVIEAGCDEAGRGCLAGSVYAAAVILPPDYHNDLLNDSKQLTEKKRYALRTEIERDAVAWAVGVCTAQEIDQINILHASYLAMHRALDKLSVRPDELIIDGNKFDVYYPAPLLLSEARGGADDNVLNGVPGKDERSVESFQKNRQQTVQHDLFGNEVEMSVKKKRSSAVSSGGGQGGALPFTTIVKGDGKYLSIAAASILAKTYRDDYMNMLAEQYPQYDWLSNKGYPTKKHRAAIAEYGPTPYHRMTFTLT